MSETCTNAATSKASSDTLSVDTIWEAIKKLPPDPIAEAMRAEGFDPDDGAILLWPISTPVDWGILGPPAYVRISHNVSVPTLIIERKA